MNNAVWNFRAMTAQDVSAVMVIELEGHEFPWTEGIFNDCMRVGYHCWVIEREGVIVGYGVMSYGAQEAHVLNVSVCATERRKGAGEAMMRLLMVQARDRGAHSLYLEVRPSNVGAIKLYEKLGFNEIGRRKDYYPAPGNRREDAILYALDLSGHD